MSVGASARRFREPLLRAKKEERIVVVLVEVVREELDPRLTRSVG